MTGAVDRGRGNDRGRGDDRASGHCHRLGRGRAAADNVQSTRSDLTTGIRNSHTLIRGEVHHKCLPLDPADPHPCGGL